MLASPRKLGYFFNNWTGRAAAFHVKRAFGKILSTRTLLRVLHRLGFTLLRPRPHPAGGDPAKQQAFFDRMRRKIQKAGPHERYLFLDAARISQEAHITRMWAMKGHRPEVRARLGKHVHVYGAIEARDGGGHFELMETVDAERFAGFLAHLTWKYPSDTLHLILDNGSPHHAARVKKMVKALGGQVKLHFLPPYSPRLNPIEKFWALLRRRLTNNTDYPDFQVLKENLVDWLNLYRQPMLATRNLCKIYYRTGNVPVSAL